MTVTDLYNLSQTGGIGSTNPPLWHTVFGIHAGIYEELALVPALVACVNNLLILFILFEQQSFPQFTIVKSLAFTDLCQSLAYGYLIMYPTSVGIPQGLLGTVVCRSVLSRYLVFSLDVTSAWHTVLFTVELYGNARRDNVNWYYDFFSSKCKSRVVIACTWVFGFLIAIPKIFYYYEENGQCYAKNISAPFSNFMGIWEFIFIIILPLMIIPSCYVIIIVKLEKSRKYCEQRLFVDPSFQTNAVACKDKIRSLSIRTTVLLIVYIVTWLPGGVGYLQYTLNRNNNILSTHFNVFVTYLPQLNAFFDPFLYAWSWKEFRLVAKRKFERHRNSSITINVN